MTVRTPITLSMTLVLMACLLTAACSSDKDNREGESMDFRILPHEENHTSFTLDMSDSTCVYEVSLISRITRKERPDSVTFHIRLTSPTGMKASETVTLPSGYHALRSGPASKDSRISTAWSAGHYDVSWLYRDNIEPLEYGEWTMDITLADGTEGVTGIGVSTVRIPIAR